MAKLPPVKVIEIIKLYFEPFYQLLCFLGIHKLSAVVSIENNKLTFKVICDRCNKISCDKHTDIRAFKAVIAYSKDYKNYELYGCSNLPNSECADIVSENMTEWYNDQHDTKQAIVFCEIHDK
jgi:hypothetical protein